jgi:IS30 family transposase
MNRVLTEEDRNRIAELAAKGWKCGRIAQVLERKASTVYWFMLKNGMVERNPDRRFRKSYVRNGVVCRPYSAEEDEFIQALRANGRSKREISDELMKQFNIRRSEHSIDVRLVLLAAVP